MKEALEIIPALRILRQANPRRLALMEGPTNCNRNCGYCEVPKRWDKEKASTLEETYRQIDWLYGQGFRVLNYIGGEPLAECPAKGNIISQEQHICPYGNLVVDSETRETLAPFRTKGNITFADHTKRVVKYASEKGMFTNVTTNGDFVDYPVLADLKKSGLDALTFSLHSLNEKALIQIVSRARMAAKERLIPIVSVVFTKDRAEAIPKVAEICAANGILFSTAIVQERGGGFSAVPEESQIPTLEQQKIVFDRLLELKKKGFVRNSVGYLQDVTSFPNNSWRCNPETNSFVHVTGTGKGAVDVCSEVSTPFQVGEISLGDQAWKETKRNLVGKCKGCLYACHYESENPNLKGDLLTLLNALLIKSGHWGLVKILGRKALGAQISKIKPIPQSEDEKFQIEYKRECKSIYGKTKKTMSNILDIGSNIAVLGIFVGYGLIKGYGLKRSIKAYEISKILPGI